MLQDLERRIAAAARGAGRIFGLTLVACLLLFAGLALLSVAGWILIEDAIGAFFATLILGLANLAAGGALFIIARPATDKKVITKKGPSPATAGTASGPATGSADANVPAMMQAFMAGFQAGRSPPPNDKPR